jgi:two-component system cell cycle response regulator
MSARILVVDDNPLNVKLLAAKLAKDYYFVITAEDGLQAIEAVKKNMPDLILLDIMMPNLDGFETCLRLKADPATRHIPIVMVTALSDVKDRVRGLECGADDFLTKPINDIALMARVRSLLRLKIDDGRMASARSDSGAIRSFPPRRKRKKNPSRRTRSSSGRRRQRAREHHSASWSGRRRSGGSVVGRGSQAKTGEGHHDLVMASLDLDDEDGLYLLRATAGAGNPRAHFPSFFLRTKTKSTASPAALTSARTTIFCAPSKGRAFGPNAHPASAKRHYDRLRKNYEQSLALALVDPLTGAYNRRYLDMHCQWFCAKQNDGQTFVRPLLRPRPFQDRERHAWTRGRRRRFKETINRVLVSLRAADLVVRTGGEEFSVIMPETEQKTALREWERLRHAIASVPMKISEDALELTETASFGVASVNHESDLSPSSILERADAALYRAKETAAIKWSAKLDGIYVLNLFLRLFLFAFLLAGFALPASAVFARIFKETCSPKLTGLLETVRVCPAITRAEARCSPPIRFFTTKTPTFSTAFHRPPITRGKMFSDFVQTTADGKALLPLERQALIPHIRA